MWYPFSYHVGTYVCSNREDIGVLWVAEGRSTWACDQCQPLLCVRTYVPMYLRTYARSCDMYATDVRR